MKLKLLSSLLFVVSSYVVAADTMLKPFVLAETKQAAMEDVVAETKSKIEAANFQLVGEVSPYPSATILVISNDKLKSHASQSQYGGYGATLRIAITQASANVQVSFTNPEYMASAYRMKESLTDTKQQLVKALGYVKDYGSDEGLSAEDLRGYHYKFMMPYFDDKLELASYSNYEDATKKVEKALTSSKEVTQIYRVDIPGKNETVIGVHMKGTTSDTECSGDKYIMDKIDFKKLKSSAHLPYEILIHEENVYALYAEFRIAISFPDLSMIGDNSFFSIMCAPDAIEAVLTKAVGGGEDN